ncbi:MULTISPECIES: DUF2382 domain-containing protein [unclassified Curtobacterium]|uniref:DUF2382 domain-containing protein n=1 Tax=unclassified Curtobacterium TaxID=257496 RepID=UPI0037F64AEB
MNAPNDRHHRHHRHHAFGDDEGIDVVRREERLLVSTEVFATERVRLERCIITEQRTVTLDVRHEEVRLTREPLDSGASLPGTNQPSADRAPVVVVLREEQVVVTTTVVPVERVTLTVHSVTEDRLVDAVLGHDEVRAEFEPVTRAAGDATRAQADAS